MITWIKRGFRGCRKAYEIFRVGGSKHLVKRVLKSVYFRVNRGRIAAATVVPVLEQNGYPEDLSQFRRVEQAREQRYSVSGSPIFYSVLTTVYEGTSAALFQSLAESVLNQTYNNFEWIVLAHGPIAPELRGVIEGLRRDSRLRIAYLPENLGIMKAMKYCLEKAEGDYIVPIDSDDLLTFDALQVFSAEILRNKFPAFLYSDEDHLRDQALFAPYERPDWDPILNMTSSYIWHLCAFSRETALRIGVYGDVSTNWCHDWDTVTRFWLASEKVLHVPEVLYHWRQHDQSTTNKSGEHSGSLESQKNLLGKIIKSAAHPDRFEVRESNVWRGAKEWSIEANSLDEDKVRLVVIHRAEAGDLNLTPFQADSSRYISTADQLVSLVLNTDAEYLCFLDSYTKEIDSAWKSNLLKYFHLVPNVLSMSGRVVDRQDRVACGGDLFHEAGFVSDPMRGQSSDAAGPFSLALKARSVDLFNLYFSAATVRHLKEILKEWEGGDSLDELSVFVGVEAWKRGLIVGHDPVVSARRELFMLNPIVLPKVQERMQTFGVEQILAKPHHGPFKSWLKE